MKIVIIFFYIAHRVPTIRVCTDVDLYFFSKNRRRQYAIDSYIIQT